MYSIAAAACVALVLIVSGDVRRRRVDGRIQHLLAAARAEGQAVSYADLARTFPDPAPAENAAVLFGAALAIATNNLIPGSTPLVMGPSLARTQPMPRSAMAELTAFAGRTSGILDALPPHIPANTRFALHWEDGLTNSRGLPFIAIRQLSQFLAAHTMQAIEAGDAERATILLEGSFRFAGTVNEENTLIYHMIHHAIDSLMIGVTERGLSRLPFSGDQLKRIAESIRVESPEAFLNVMRSEHCIVIATSLSVRDGVPLDLIIGRRKSAFFVERVWDRIQRLWQPDYDDGDFIRYLEQIPKFDHALSLRPPEATNVVAKATAEYDSRSVSRIARDFVGNWPKVLAAHLQGQARISALIATLAIERYRRDHEGRMPASFVDLVPSYLPGIPQDPCSGHPLKVKQLPRGYVVYSVGADGVDNGGREGSPPAINPPDVTVIIENRVPGRRQAS